MTYCVGIILDRRMILASDSRTHAGVDNFAKFCKMTVFERSGDRVLVLLSSGDLAGTQAVISVLKQRGDAEGDFIEAGLDTPFFQTGETKYGKPILDRVITRSTALADAAKCVLVSFDSTMRSNLSVGMPIDLICYQRDSLEIQMRRRFDEGDTYFTALSRRWCEGVR